MLVKPWCCKNEGFPWLRPSLLILGSDSHLVLTVWLEAEEGECLFKQDAVVPGPTGNKIFLLESPESYLSLSFLLDKGGMMFVQFDLFTVPFLFGSYNL